MGFINFGEMESSGDLKVDFRRLCEAIQRELDYRDQAGEDTGRRGTVRVVVDTSQDEKTVTVPLSPAMKDEKYGINVKLINNSGRESHCTPLWKTRTRESFEVTVIESGELYYEVR
jgi:hypothetical protein